MGGPSVRLTRPTHPREQFLAQGSQVLWLPVVERHQGIHDAMLQHTQGSLRVNTVPTTLELQNICDLQPLTASTKLRSSKVKCAQQAYDGQQECSGRQALGGSPQTVATACLNAAMHWHTHHRLQVQFSWEPPCTQKFTKALCAEC